jgi:hypothetical protein
MEVGFTMKPEHSIERTVALKLTGRIADGAMLQIGDPDRIRWFPALVGNHVVDLVNKYKGDLPEGLTRYVRGRTGYDYLHRAEVGSSNADFVTDEIVDRFGIVGDVEARIAKLRVLAEAGVDQFNLYLMNGNEDEQLEIYGRQIIPALRDVRAAKA